MNVRISQLIVVFCTALLAAALNGCVLAVAGAMGAGAGAAVGSDSRTVDTMVDDEIIEQRAAEIIKTNPLLSDRSLFNVSVYSVSGNVLLVGQTLHMEYLNWCITEFKKLDYIRHIYNYVENRKPVSMATMTGDSYITSKIKAKMLLGQDIKSGRFKVVTEDGNVFLMGYVTRDEANRAVNVAKTVDGVTRVYTIFDYFDYPETYAQGYKREEIVIEPVDASSSGGYAAQSYRPAPQAVMIQPANSSSYVIPAASGDNGGAILVDDSDLLAP